MLCLWVRILTPHTAQSLNAMTIKITSPGIPNYTFNNLMYNKREFQTTKHYQHKNTVINYWQKQNVSCRPPPQRCSSALRTTSERLTTKQLLVWHTACQTRYPARPDPNRWPGDPVPTLLEVAMTTVYDAQDTWCVTSLVTQCWI